MFLKSVIEKIKHLDFFSPIGETYTPKNIISSAAFAKKLLPKNLINCRKEYKLVILGSAGSGKTTTLRSIGGLNPSNTRNSEADKERIVGIDYGRISLTDDLKLNLIGYSGRVQFKYMWEATAKDADAIMVLLDMAHENPLSELKFFLKMLRNKYAYQGDIICALTHTDHSKHNIETLKKKVIAEAGKNTQLYQYDPRSKLQSLKVITDIGHDITKRKAHN
ncbi:ADP-ribosylation factor-like protein [Marinicella sp. W31]|uniref:ADP-ribosylation factor-like protein n=1 Tax=Marinicella sp. W31 TaxID=3023713 RepID=UPI0037569BD8